MENLTNKLYEIAERNYCYIGILIENLNYELKKNEKITDIIDKDGKTLFLTNQNRTINLNEII